MNRKIVGGVFALLVVAGLAVLVVERSRRSTVANGDAVGGEMMLPEEKEALENGKALTPERAEERLAKIMAIPEVNIRAREAGLLVRDLCQAGYAEDAWRMVDGEKGQVREVQLLAFFRFSKLGPAALLAKMAELPRKEEVKRALDGMFSGGTLVQVDELLSQPGIAAAVAALESGYPADMKPVMAEYTHDRMTGVRSDEDRAAIGKFAKRMYELKVIREADLMELVRMDTSRDILERWREVSAMAAGAPGAAGNATRRELLRMLVSEGAEKALEVLRESDTPQGWEDLAAGARQWYADYPEDVAKWLTGQAAGLSVGQRDAVYAALSAAATEKGDAPAAAKWAEKVEDAALRQQLSGK